MTNLEEPMDIDEGWKQIKAKAIDVLLEQLQQGFDEKARPFDVSYFFPLANPCIFQKNPFRTMPLSPPAYHTHLALQLCPFPRNSHIRIYFSTHPTHAEQGLHGGLHHLLQFVHSTGPS